MTQTEMFPEEKSQLQEIHDLLKITEELEETMANLDQELTEMAKKFRNLTETVIPDMMREAGMESFTTVDGKTVSIDKFYSAKISTNNEEEAFSWLEKTGNSAIIKNELVLSLKKNQQEELKKAMEALDATNLPYTKKQSVHASTLKAFVKEQIENGKELPMETFGVFIGEKVKVKK